MNKEPVRIKIIKSWIFELKCFYDNINIIKHYDDMVDDIIKEFPNKYNGEVEYYFNGTLLSRKEFEKVCNIKVSDKERKKFLRNFAKKNGIEYKL